jgi:hypothetical protein
MRVALGMPVEQAAEQRPARSLDLGDEHQGLTHRDYVLDPDPRERPQLPGVAQVVRAWQAIDPGFRSVVCPWHRASVVAGSDPHGV